MQTRTRMGGCLRNGRVLLLAGFIDRAGIICAGRHGVYGWREACRKVCAVERRSATFKSDALGEVTVDWSKVKELQIAQAFAVIPKGVDIEEEVEILRRFRKAPSRWPIRRSL